MHDKRIKALTEKRDEVLEAMSAITAGAVDENGEERALTEEEQTKFNELETQAKNLNASIKAEERARDLECTKEPEKRAAEQTEEQRAEERAAAEERAFENYIRGVVSEDRAGDVNMTAGDNGAVIPASIANKIITKVYDICPIAQLATRYDVKGTLSIPYYPVTGESGETPDITMGYATEFSALESTSGAFTSIDLQAFLAGVLTKVSKSLVNNSQFNIVNFVIEKMAESIARWLEGELLNGTASKIRGLADAANVVTAAAATFITGDDLIDLQDAVKDAYQGNAIWIMAPSTRNAIRKLKDGQGNYLLERDFTAKWGYKLLGKDVYISDNMTAIGASKKSIYYGDMSGLALKFSEDINIEVLRERFATEHAIGVVGYCECDAKIENEQKIAVLAMAATDPAGTTGTT